MTELKTALIEEFTRLRHGPGLAATNLRERVGPNLVALCGIVPTDNDRAIRQKILSTVERLTKAFSPEDQLAVNMSLGGIREAQLRLLSARVDMLAIRLVCAPRTARRRIDDATTALAEEAQQALTITDEDDDPERGWFVRRFEALYRLDTPTPELSVTRTIVAERDNLSRIAFRFSLPATEESGPEPRDIGVDVQQGAWLAGREQLSDGHFRFLLALPKPLARGAEHRYTMVFRAPPGQPVRTHYALVPLVQIDSFQVRVRFDPRQPPEAVWRLHHMAPNMLNGRLVPGESLVLDDAYEMVLEFDRMKTGFGYGLAWRMPGK